MLFSAAHGRMFPDREVESQTVERFISNDEENGISPLSVIFKGYFTFKPFIG